MNRGEKPGQQAIEEVRPDDLMVVGIVVVLFIIEKPRIMTYIYA